MTFVGNLVLFPMMKTLLNQLKSDKVLARFCQHFLIHGVLYPHAVETTRNVAIRLNI